MKKDGDKWRRVVASPLPKQIFEIRPIKWLLQKGTVVIAAGGGGCDAASDTFMPATLADKRRRVTAATTKKTGTSPHLSWHRPKNLVLVGPSGENLTLGAGTWAGSLPAVLGAGIDWL